MVDVKLLKVLYHIVNDGRVDELLVELKIVIDLLFDFLDEFCERRKISDD